MLIPEINFSNVFSWLYTNVATVIVIIVIALATIIFAKLINRLLDAYFSQAGKKLMVDPTIYRLLRHIIVSLVYLIGIILIILSIPQLRNLSVALFAGAGFAGIVIGLAAQSTLGNIISGISLAIFQPFRVGDIVSIHDEYGKISDLNLRHTVVTTWDNRRLIIPNSVISDEAIINWSIEDPTIIWPLNIGISYDSDIELARSIMIDVARKHQNVMEFHQINPLHPEISPGSEIKVLVTELGDFAVNLRLLVWINDRSIAFITGCELMESIKKRFDAEGVEIPFPYRTLVYKKDLPPNASSNKGLVDVPDARGNEVHSQGSQE